MKTIHTEKVSDTNRDKDTHMENGRMGKRKSGRGIKLEIKEGKSFGMRIASLSVSNHSGDQRFYKTTVYHLLD